MIYLLDPLEPVLWFTKPLVPEKLDAAGIVPPSDSSTRNGTIARTHKFHGRIGRGGRIVFDRCNPLMHSSTDKLNARIVRAPALFVREPSVIMLRLIFM
ncbi:hypothetical protein CISIN_1g037239mg [Citrus sinensis]|uniref:Uncharacterized protein n=1 Tax=Citrus sinensis TaxID=2711 RepID=A0A067D046_CITSI|nr:hypothetical protein CISIN_1g037239mg [Citrus sinensis]